MNLKIILAYMRKARFYSWVVSYEGLFAFNEQVKNNIRIAPSYNLCRALEDKKNVG